MPNEEKKPTMNNCELELVKQKTLVLEASKTIPMFSGTDPNWTFAQFEKKFKDFAKWLAWGEEDQFMIASQRIQGRALELFEIHRDRINNITDFFEVLKKFLAQPKSQGELHAQLWSYFQAQDTPVADYIARARTKARLAAAALEVDTETKKTVQEGWLMGMLLTNLLPEIRKAVIARNPTTSQEIEEFALLEEKAINAVKGELGNEIACAVAPSSVGRTLENLVADLSDQISKLNCKVDRLENKTWGEERGGRTREMVCFGCQNNGHFIRDCPLVRNNVH